MQQIFSVKYDRKHKIFTIFGIKIKLRHKPLFYKLKYDKIFTLGYNCELAQRLLDIFGGEFEHYLLTWAYTHDRKKLPNILKNIDTIWQDNFKILGSMILAEKSQIAFHPRGGGILKLMAQLMN